MRCRSLAYGFVLVLAIAWTTQETSSALDTPPATQVGEKCVRPQQEGTQAVPIPAKGQTKEYSISVESNLVLLDVLVTDEDGNVLGGLKRGNFRILDNGKPQIILLCLQSRVLGQRITYDMKPAIQVDFTRNKAEARQALGSLSYPQFNKANLFIGLVATIESSSM